MALFHRMHKRIQQNEQPQRLMYNQYLRRASSYKNLLYLNHMLLGTIAGMKTYDALANLYNEPTEITPPIIGIIAGSATTLGLSLLQKLAATYLRNYDLNQVNRAIFPRGSKNRDHHAL
jgi:hypothetical protein